VWIAGGNIPTGVGIMRRDSLSMWVDQGDGPVDEGNVRIENLEFPGFGKSLAL